MTYKNISYDSAPIGPLGLMAKTIAPEGRTSARGVSGIGLRPCAATCPSGTRGRDEKSAAFF